MKIFRLPSSFFDFCFRGSAGILLRIKYFLTCFFIKFPREMYKTASVDRIFCIHVYFYSLFWHLDWKNRYMRLIIDIRSINLAEC